MHGEYKVPGGKLVVIDLDVEAERLVNVRLAGDFFLEPDELLGELDRAVTGLPAVSTAAEIAAAVQAAIPPDAVLLGVTPEAIGTAVRRAVTGASGWQDYPWRLLRGPALDPVVQVALDQVLTERVGLGQRPATLRFWQWETPGVVIGSFQSLKNEVDLGAAARYGIPVVRRISGGGAMFMEAGSVIMYSIYAPTDLVAGMSFADSYAFLDDFAVAALRALGIEAEYKPLNDITSRHGKIGGAAQKRLSHGAVLHHTALSYDIDGQRMTEVLRIGREKLSDKGIASAVKRVDPLRSQTGLPRGLIEDRLIEEFRNRYGLVDDVLTAPELAIAQELVRTKFGTREWLERVP